MEIPEGLTDYEAYQKYPAQVGDLTMDTIDCFLF